MARPDEAKRLTSLLYMLSAVFPPDYVTLVMGGTAPGDTIKLMAAPVTTYTAVVERCTETGCFVGYAPGFPGAHSLAESLDELNRKLREVLALLLENGEATLETDVCTQLVTGG